MIEYLYNAIRATAGEDVTITAVITDSQGGKVTTNCNLMLSNDLMHLETFIGAFDGEEWSFTIPGAFSHNKVGRFWYCICADSESLCFKQPIYFI